MNTVTNDMVMPGYVIMLKRVDNGAVERYRDANLNTTIYGDRQTAELAAERIRKGGKAGVAHLYVAYVDIVIR
jgi:hypothetical protein